jgi:transcriptional regulator of acetoin/glycerol metabolism
VDAIEEAREIRALSSRAGHRRLHRETHLDVGRAERVAREPLAACELGLSRQAFYRRMERLGIAVERKVRT